MHVVDEPADAVAMRDQRVGLDPGDGLAHVVVEVGKGFEREWRPDSGVSLHLRLELLVCEAEHPAVGVVEQDDLASAEQPL